MTTPSDNSMSPRTALFIFTGGWIAMLFLSAIELLGLGLEFPEGSNIARIWDGIVLLSIIFILASTIAAGIAMTQEITMREFIRWAIDIALLPLTVPLLLVLCLWIGLSLISNLAIPWFGEQFAQILGFEVGLFVILLAVPYLHFVWPILHRVQRSRSAEGYRIAPKTWMVICGFAAFSIIITLAQPPIILWFVVCLLWLSFSAFYHWLLPRFPRYIDDGVSGSIESPNVG